MDFKLLGSILLIVGTSIGAGMLALPIATSLLGFWGSVMLLFACWFIMTMGALLLLEVNLWMPQNSNLITMAKATIGPSGQIISWLTFLLLLYSLLCAYIAGGSDLFHHLVSLTGIELPLSLCTILFTFAFGSIVFLGIRSIDYTNRGLMAVKFSAFFILLFLLAPFISAKHLADGSIENITSVTAVMVTITSFGYAAIIPSLRVYFAGDIKKLKQAIFIGSLIPLVCYIAWDAAIMGVIPLDGSYGLVDIMHAKGSTSDFVSTLSRIVSRTQVTFFAKLFTSICVLTSFLGVSLALTDFFADGFQLEKKGASNFIICGAAFLPPMLVVLFFPNVFIKMLEYAGLYCVLLLILIPAWMAWRGRYHKHLADGFQVSGGKPLLAVLILFSIIMLVWGIIK